MTARDREFMLEGFLEAAAVEHARQRVGGGEVLEVGNTLVLLREVLRDLFDQGMGQRCDLRDGLGAFVGTLGAYLFREADKLCQLRDDGILLRRRRASVPARTLTSPKSTRPRILLTKALRVNSFKLETRKRLNWRSKLA